LNDLACTVYPNIVGDVTGSTAPYHITQPLTNDVQIVSSIATMANMTCSLNDTVPSKEGEYPSKNDLPSKLKLTVVVFGKLLMKFLAAFKAKC